MNVRAKPEAPVPKVWAIRNRNWVELRKGKKAPRPKTTTAEVEVTRRLPGHAVWNPNIGTYVRLKSERKKEKVKLVTTIYVGGTPFKWVSVAHFIKKSRIRTFRHGEIREVPGPVAEYYLKEGK